VGGWSVAAAAFIGGLSAVLLITFAAQKTGASRTTVVLGGVAVNSFLNALTEGITVIIPEAGMMTADFRIGGFSSVAYTRLIPAAALIAVGLAAVFTLCNELDLMAMGEHTAQGLGLSVKKMLPC
jgi:iron complex transport system permease protein